MALREERNEQNSQAWRAHFERERMDLSASVEAALLDDGHILAAQWDDELDEQDEAQPVTGGTALVPPRLTLQSKTLPAVRPERVIATTGAYQAAQVVEAEQQPSGMLARLARRFTSSFAAVKLESPQQQVPPASSTQAFNQATLAAYQPAPVGKLLSAPVDPPLVRVIDIGMSPDPIVEERQTEPQQRRSLKRNGKVRLQTTEQPAITKASLSPRIEEQETGEALLADVRNALKGQQASPVIPAPYAVPVPVYGSGAFEGGQGDVMVANALVTASSVVLVTLTTNPGPVVMQYISLQPRVGFTVHLTAPVSMRTTFNYVLFVGEMPVA